MDTTQRLHLLADGLRATNERVAQRVHQDLLPIPGIAYFQVERFQPEARALGTELGHVRASLATPDAALRDAVAGMEQLEQLVGDGSFSGRRAYRAFGVQARALADRIDAAVPAPTADSLAASRAQLDEVLVDGAADVTIDQARAALDTAPSAIAGPAAAQWLGVDDPAIATEFVTTLHKVVDRTASSFDRERLGIIELVARNDAASTAALRRAALDIVSQDPRTLTATAWHRLAALLELDPTARHLPGPRELGDGVRPLTDVAHRAALGTRGRYVKPKLSPAVTQYFTQWQTALLDAEQASGTLFGPGRDPNIRRLFQRRVPEIQQLVADLGLVGASSFDEITDALRFVDTHTRRIGGDATDARIQALARSTRDLIDKNIARLDLTLRDGYSNHPDYAELGRVRENLRLLEAADAMRARAASVPATATEPGGRLTW